MITTPRRLRRAATAAAALTLALGAAACGDDDDQSAATQADATTTTGDAPAATVEIAAVDYRFDDLPGHVAAGSTLALRNASDGEVHELVAMRLADGEDRTADELVALPEPELRALFGGPPSLAVVAPPGEEGFVALGDGTLAEPGRYLLMCFIPTGADPGAFLDALEANPGEPPSVPGGPPHFTAGMFGELTVR